MEWRPIPGYEGVYEVSEMGVRSLPRRISTGQWRDGVELRGHLVARGYRQFTLTWGGKMSRRTHHSLMAEVFLGPRPPGALVLHRDDDPANNSVSNLYYGTPSENNLDQVKNGRHRQTQKTRCPVGHLLVGDNLVPSSLKKGQRKCRSCVQGRNAARYQDVDRRVVSEKFYQALMVEVSGDEDRFT